MRPYRQRLCRPTKIHAWNTLLGMGWQLILQQKPYRYLTFFRLPNGIILISKFLWGGAQSSSSRAYKNPKWNATKTSGKTFHSPSVCVCVVFCCFCLWLTHHWGHTEGRALGSYFLVWVANESTTFPLHTFVIYPGYWGAPESLRARRKWLNLVTHEWKYG